MNGLLFQVRINSWKKKSFRENSSLRVTKHEPDNPMTQSSKDINYTGRELNFTRKKSHECLKVSCGWEASSQNQATLQERLTERNCQKPTSSNQEYPRSLDCQQLTTSDKCLQLSSAAGLSTTNISTQVTHSASADSFRHQLEQSLKRVGEVYDISDFQSP